MHRKTIIDFKNVAYRGIEGQVIFYKPDFIEYIFWLLFFDIFEEHRPCWM